MTGDAILMVTWEGDRLELHGHSAMTVPQGVPHDPKAEALKVKTLV
jgi:hypothetical protein